MKDARYMFQNNNFAEFGYNNHQWKTHGTCFKIIKWRYQILLSRSKFGSYNKYKTQNYGTDLFLKIRTIQEKINALVIYEFYLKKIYVRLTLTELRRNWFQAVCSVICVSVIYFTALLIVFFPWRYITHCGFVFYSPLSGFSLLAYEVTWSHTTTRHSR
jgi:hypothetical protein